MSERDADWDGLVRFLEQKKASLSLAEEAGLVKARQGKTGYYDLFRHRLMFTIMNPMGEVIGFGGRVLDDSQPKYLGVKAADGQTVKTGQVIVRQRGTRIEAGKNVEVGKDHTLFATAAGKVTFRYTRKTRFNGATVSKKVVDVVTA